MGFFPTPSLDRRPATLGVRGGVPAWVPLLLVLLGAAWLWQTGQTHLRQEGLTRVDLTRSALFLQGHTAPPEWGQTLREVVAAESAILADRPDELADLRETLMSLPFVAEVGPLRVLWPDGIDVSLRLHEPIACVRVGAKFYPVAMLGDEQRVRGILLPSQRTRPHQVGPAGGARIDLPVLATLDGHALQTMRAGDEFLDGALLAALDIAQSMAQHLQPEQRARMGRVLIDSTRTEAFDGLPGGATLDLEGSESSPGGRRIHFGHAPCEAGPGELPAARKWEHVGRAIEAGFQTVDVRFDSAEYHGREGD